MKKPTALLVSLSLVAFVSSQNVFLSSNLFGNNGGGMTPPVTQPSSIITLPSDNQISTVANDFGSFTLNLGDLPSLNPTGGPNPNTESTPETTETTETSSIFENINTQPIWTPPTTSEVEAENIMESPPTAEESLPPIEIVPEQENTPFPPVNEEALIETPAITFTPENGVVLGEEILEAGAIGNPLETPVTATALAQTAPSTVQCNFNADGQIVCQTCYYQTGCNDPTACPIDHCE